LAFPEHTKSGRFAGFSGRGWRDSGAEMGPDSKWRDRSE